MGFFTVASDLNGGGSCTGSVAESACKNGNFHGHPLHSRNGDIALPCYHAVQDKLCSGLGLLFSGKSMWKYVRDLVHI